MGNAQSSLLGRMLAETQLWVDANPNEAALLRCTSAGAPGAVQGLAGLEWADDLPDFACWSGDFGMPRPQLFAFLVAHVMPAKACLGLPMALFPKDPPGLRFAAPGEEPPLEQPKAWEQPPDAALLLHNALGCASAEGLAWPLLSAVVLERRDAANGRRLSVAIVPLGGPAVGPAAGSGWRQGAGDDRPASAGDATAQRGDGAGAFALELSPVALRDMMVGDHVVYVDTHTSSIGMEHNLIVVHTCPTVAAAEGPGSDGEAQAAPLVLCVGVSTRSRWIYTSLTLVHLNKALAALPRPPLMLRAQVVGPCPAVQRSASERAAVAMACIGLHGVWFGSTMNCEDWANWVSTGYCFSVQRMRALTAQRLSVDSLVRLPDPSSPHAAGAPDGFACATDGDGGAAAAVYDHRDVAIACDVLGFCNSCTALRSVRLAALPMLQTHENFR
jgi:hypothetical protein